MVYPGSSRPRQDDKYPQIQKGHFSMPKQINFYNQNYRGRRRPANYSPKYTWRPYHQRPKRKPRTPSPTLGSEEYTLRKIQITSEKIMQQLLNPQEEINVVSEPIPTTKEAAIESQTTSLVNNNKQKSDSSCSNKTYSKKITLSDVKIIHSKIVNHITKLNDGRKKNLINSNASGLDVYFEQIQKQQRLEISRALREMCKEKTQESTDYINSIIPDIGIKIEELPSEFIEQLSNTLDYDFEVLDEPPVAQPLIPKSKKNDIEITSPITEVIKCEIDSEEETDLQKDEIDGKSLITIVDHELCYNEDTELGTIKNEIEVTEENIQIQADKIEDTATSLDNFCPAPSLKNRVKDAHTQTETPQKHSLDGLVNSYIETCNKNPPESIAKAVAAMFDIDEAILKLTNYRKSLFSKYHQESTDNNEITTEGKKHHMKKLKVDQVKRLKIQTNCNNETLVKKNKENNKTAILEEMLRKSPKAVLTFSQLQAEVVIVKILENQLILGTHSGKILYLSLASGATTATINASSMTITSMAYWKGNATVSELYTCSLDGMFKVYDFHSKQLQRQLVVISTVRTMDVAWNIVFMGCSDGALFRYDIKTQKFMNSCDTISASSICSLIATVEGTRKILLVGSKNWPICIRDAMSGLFLRSMDNKISPTVTAMLLHKTLLYCASTEHGILTYSFNDGILMRKLPSSDRNELSCLKIVGNLLFTGSYKGGVQVYFIPDRRYVGFIQGPGGGILCMEVYENQIIVGTTSFQFKAILIPNFMLKLIR